ncbi:MAG: YbhB/YbcL family Raf kinase inhibitor-like protein [Thermodesulfobacteriota bacterium]
MKLNSPAFGHEGKIPTQYTCDGENINPPLSILEAPGATQSLVLIMEDPDVPKNLKEDGMWDHWVVFNIPPDLREILEGKEPEGTGGIGTNGEKGYFGPCPPDREHRYFFKLFALDTKLELPEGATKAEVEKAMNGHILDETHLMGRYERK